MPGLLSHGETLLAVVAKDVVLAEGATTARLAGGANYVVRADGATTARPGLQMER